MTLAQTQEASSNIYTDTVLQPLEVFDENRREAIVAMRREFLRGVHLSAADDIEMLSDDEVQVAAENTLEKYPVIKGLGQAETISLKGLHDYLNGQDSASIGRSRNKPSFVVDRERTQTMRNMSLAFKNFGSVGLSTLLESPERLVRKIPISSAKSNLLNGIYDEAAVSGLTEQEGGAVIDVFANLYTRIMHRVPCSDTATTLRRIAKLAEGKKPYEIAEEDNVVVTTIYTTKARFIETLLRGIRPSDRRIIIDQRGDVDDSDIEVIPVRPIEAVYMESDISESSVIEKSIVQLSRTGSTAMLPAIRQRSRSAEPAYRPYSDLGLRVLGSYQTSGESFLTPEDTERIKKYSKLVAQIVRNSNLFPASQLEDAYQVGLMGLINACKLFDSARESSFQAYAAHRIYGSLVDSIRESSPVSRTVLEQGKKVATLRENGFDRNEICEHLNIAPKKLDEIEYMYSLRIAVSLEDLGDNQSNWGEWLEVGVNTDDYPSLKPSAGDLLDQLPALLRSQKLNERDVDIVMSYLGGEKLLSAANRYGITESRASQIFGSAIKKLQAHVKAGDRIGQLIIDHAA